MTDKSYAAVVKTHLEQYKETVLGVAACGLWHGRPYGHILPEREGWRNILASPSLYAIDEQVLTVKATGAQLKLHDGWRHLNSSQILCLSFFLPILSDTAALSAVACALGADKKAVGGRFEVMTEDRSNIDFVIDLEGGGCVYIEVKYTETEFGAAGSGEKRREIYAAAQKRHHSAADMDFADYCRHYQLVRNLCLSPAHSGNLTVFLVPRGNESIRRSYAEGMAALRNQSDFSQRLFFWEDLADIAGSRAFWEKYFPL